MFSFTKPIKTKPETAYCRKGKSKFEYCINYEFSSDEITEMNIVELVNFPSPSNLLYCGLDIDRKFTFCRYYLKYRCK